MNESGKPNVFVTDKKHRSVNLEQLGMTEPVKLDDMELDDSLKAIDNYYDGKPVELHPDDLEVLQRVKETVAKIDKLYLQAIEESYGKQKSVLPV